MERKTQLRPADSSQNLPLQSYNAGFKWIWQPKNETLVPWLTAYIFNIGIHVKVKPYYRLKRARANRGQVCFF